MKPPEDLLASMSNDSIGIMTSIVCLGAALQVKRGTFAPLESVTDPFTGERMDAGLETKLKEMHRALVEDLRRATPDEIDHSIALYEAHLKRCGVKAEWGAIN